MCVCACITECMRKKVVYMNICLYIYRLDVHINYFLSHTFCNIYIYIYIERERERNGRFGKSDEM